MDEAGVKAWLEGRVIEAMAACGAHAKKLNEMSHA